MTPTSKLSLQEYLDCQGTRCPHCGADGPTDGSFTVDGNVARQELFCHACGASWDDVFVKTHIEDFEPPEETL